MRMCWNCLLYTSGRALSEKQVRGVQAYFSVYMLLFAVSWLLLSLDGFDLISTFTALASCINLSLIHI